MSSFPTNGPPASIDTTDDKLALADYTNSLEGALDDAKEHIAAITTDRDLMLASIKEQQQKMIEQHEQFMAMMVTAGLDNSKNATKNTDTG